MSSAPERKRRDPTLLGLFQQEAREGAQKLIDGLQRLDGSGDIDALVLNMLHAAHAVKGAGRIVAVDAAAELAGALEECLEHLHGSGLAPEPALAGSLFAAARLLARFGEVDVDVDDFASHHRLELNAAMDGLALPRSPVTATVKTTGTTSAATKHTTPLSVRPLTARPPPNPALLQLFRDELERCSSSIAGGLLELERDPNAGRAWEEVLRSAHSIKGAARILGLSRCERLTHLLEDQLIEARESQAGLTGGRVDRLLEAVDTLQAAGRAIDRAGDGLDALERRCNELALHLDPASAGDSLTVTVKRPSRRPPTDGARHITLVPPSGLAAPSPPPAPVVPAPTQKQTSPADQRVLRIAAESVDRLMALAGESLVEARRVASFGKAVERMRRSQRSLLDALSALDAQGAEGPVNGAAASLADAKMRARDCAALMVTHASELETYARRAELLSEGLYREALKSRMRPFADGAHGFPRLVRDLARQLGKNVRFEMVGAQTEVDRDVLESLDAPLNHILRNAIDHGVESPEARAQAGKPVEATLRLEARHHAGLLVISVTDDGRGIDPEHIRGKALKRSHVSANVAASLTRAELLEFLFLPGFTTTEVVTEVSGRGIGLDVVRSAVEAASGTVRLVSDLGVGTSFHLQLPVTRSVVRALVAQIAGESYAFPLLRIERILRLPSDEVRTVGNQSYFVQDDANIGLVSARQVMGLSGAPGESALLAVVVIGERAQRYGMIVDGFSGEHDLVVRPLDPRLGKVQDIAAAAVLADGTPALIVDVDDLLRTLDRAVRAGDLAADVTETFADQAPKQRILVVDDSITVREAERQLLANGGYDVDVAVDGIDALNAVRRANYDLIVTDVDMPRLNGIELVKALKRDSGLRAIPVVIVSYKDRSEDRMRGLEAGANYYLTKSSFYDATLLDAVEALIGREKK